MKMFNSVAHPDTNCNDTGKTQRRGKGGRPKKGPLAPLANGFPACIAQSAYFNVPTVFLDVIAAIDNLAELKVVLYILRHTWGFHEFEKPLHITTDEFMHGRKKADGTRMDSGTGLSKSAVLNGLDRAMKHGFLDCSIDDHDKARIQHFYCLKMQNEVTQDSPDSVTALEETAIPDENDVVTSNVPEETVMPLECTTVHENNQDGLFPEEQETEEYDPYADTIFSKNYQSPEQKIFAPEPEPITPTEVVDNSISGRQKLQRSNKRTSITNLRKKEIRIAPIPENFEEVIRSLPTPNQFPKAKPKAPAAIRNIMTDFSRDLGDHEHIPSNIAQAVNLYHNSRMSEETFIQTLYDARALAKRATQIKYVNSHGGMNRMPYFFKCLSGASKQECQTEEVG
jgi:hypothetical protein